MIIEIESTNGLAIGIAMIIAGVVMVLYFGNKLIKGLRK